MLQRLVRNFSTLPKWATVDPFTLSGSKPHTVHSILDGKLIKYNKTIPIVHPLNGEQFLNVSVPDKDSDLNAFIESQKNVPKYGLHNPIKNVQRYVQYGDIFMRIASEMRKPEV